MALNTRSFIRVPPDSTGKRSSASFTLALDYTARINPIIVGDVVVGDSSGTQGTVLEIIEETASTAGTLILKMEGDFANDSFTNSENLRVDGTSVATADNTGVPILYNESVIVGKSDPTKGMDVDERGAAYVRFSDGPARLDSLGSLIVDNELTILRVKHVNKPDPLMSEILVGGGSGSWNRFQTTHLMTVDNVSGSSAIYRSDVWPKYDPGAAMSFRGHVIAGDTGKSGLIRRWGLFDNEDGVYFEQSGSIINACIRSSIDGTITTIKYPQSEWNVDRVDGTSTINNLSGFDLDVSKANIYNIDYQWYGAGEIRFAVVIGAKIITVHTIQTANTNSRPFMRRPGLPLSFEMTNFTGTAGTSEFRVVAASLKTSQNWNPKHEHYSGKFADLPFTASYSSSVPLFSARAAQTGSNGYDNRSYSIPQNAYIQTFDGDIILEVVYDADLSGSVWQTGLIPDSNAEFDFAASGSSGGRVIKSVLVKQSEVTELELKETFDSPELWLSRKADITLDPVPITIKVQPLKNGPQTGSIAVTFDYTTYED